MPMPTTTRRRRRLHQAQEVAASPVDSSQVREIDEKALRSLAAVRVLPHKLKQRNPGPNEPAMKFKGNRRRGFWLYQF
jgi:hypothetical protein